MSDLILLGVLKMPPKLWTGDKLDIHQRYARYKQAADRIQKMTKVLEAIVDWDIVNAINHKKGLKYSLPVHIRKEMQKILSA